MQYYAIRQRASEAGISMSDYLRQAVVSARIVPRLSRQDSATLSKLAGEANNVNQLVHRAHKYGLHYVERYVCYAKSHLLSIRFWKPLVPSRFFWG
jgi:hypothetical protein